MPSETSQGFRHVSVHLKYPRDEWKRPLRISRHEGLFVFYRHILRGCSTVWVETRESSGLRQLSDQIPALHMTLGTLFSLPKLPLLHVKRSKN